MRSVPYESKLLDHLFSQTELLNLSGNGHRKLGRETDIARNLIRRDLPAAIIANFFFCSRLSFAQPDPGAHFLAVLGVRYSDNLHVADLGVPMQEFLDLARIDVLAATN